MPTYNIKEITGIKFMKIEDGEYSELFEIGQEIPVIETKTEMSENVTPSSWDNEYSFSLDFTSPNDYYKLRNIAIGGGKKKYRYKQIKNVLKMEGKI